MNKFRNTYHGLKKMDSYYLQDILQNSRYENNKISLGAKVAQFILDERMYGKQPAIDIRKNKR